MKYSLIFVSFTLVATLFALPAWAEKSYSSVDQNEQQTQGQDQENAAPAKTDRYFGLQLGPSLSSAATTPTSPAPMTGSRARLSIGGFAAFSLFSDILYFQPEADFVQRGFDVIDASGNAAATVDLSYLEIPLLLKARYNMGTMKPFLAAGPSLGFLLSKSATTTTVQNNQIVTAPNLGLQNSIGSLSLAIDIGAGVDFDLTKVLGAFVSLRYSLGISNILSDTVTDTTASIKNNSLQLLGGLQLAI